MYYWYCTLILCINRLWTHLIISLYFFQGVSISEMPKLIQPHHVVALCSLVASLQRCTGIWRLQEVSLMANNNNRIVLSNLSFTESVSVFNYVILCIVSQKVLGCYKWPESQESDFVYSKCIFNSYGRQIPSTVIYWRVLSL